MMLKDRIPLPKTLALVLDTTLGLGHDFGAKYANELQLCIKNTILFLVVNITSYINVNIYTICVFRIISNENPRFTA